MNEKEIKELIKDYYPTPADFVRLVTRVAKAGFYEKQHSQMDDAQAERYACDMDFFKKLSVLLYSR